MVWSTGGIEGDDVCFVFGGRESRLSKMTVMPFYKANSFLLKLGGMQHREEHADRWGQFELDERTPLKARCVNVDCCRKERPAVGQRCSTSGQFVLLKVTVSQVATFVSTRTAKRPAGQSGQPIVTERALAFCSGLPATLGTSP
ncbi:Histidinol-phosphate aminotransferase [Trichinella pseudospiralis]